MAISSVNEHHEGRSSRTTKDGVRELVRQFIVVVTTANTSVAAVERANDGTTAIPRVGDKHDVVTAARCRGVSTQSYGDGRMVHLVRCEYTSAFVGPPAGAGPVDFDNPLDDPPDVSFSTDFIQVLVTKEENVAAGGIINSASDPIEMFKQEDMARITVKRNVSKFSVQTMLDYTGSINSATLVIAGHTILSREAKIDTYGGERAERNGIKYFVQTISFVIDVTNHTARLADLSLAGGWDRIVLDAGYNEIDDAGTGKKQIKINGKPAQSPQLLDGAGAHQPNPTTDPVYLDFDIYPQQDFSLLGLPKHA